MNGQIRMDEMFAFICVDDDGTEYIPCIDSGLNKPVMPLAGCDMRRVEILKPFAEMVAKTLKKKLTLVKFTHREDVETIE